MKRTGGQSQFLGLFSQGCNDFRMAVALIDGRVGREKVVIGVALNVSYASACTVIGIVYCEYMCMYAYCDSIEKENPLVTMARIRTRTYLCPRPRQRGVDGNCALHSVLPARCTWQFAR